MRTTRKVQSFVTVIAMVCLASLAAPAAESEKQTITVPPEIERGMQMPEGKEKYGVLNAAALEWLKREPTSALAWANELPTSSFTLKKVRESVFCQCGEFHGKIAADWSVQKKVYGGLHKVLDFWAKADPSAAGEWCKQAPEEVRHIAFCSLGDGLTYKDPAASTALFKKLDLKNLDDQRSMVYGISKAWTWARPKEAEAAIAWAMGIKPQEVRLAALYGIGQGWSRQYLPATTAWIKTLKNKEEIRTAAYGVVKMMQTGLTEKQQGTERNREAEHYEAAYAKEWLDQFPLSDAEKETILNGKAISMKDPGNVVWPQ